MALRSSPLRTGLGRTATAHAVMARLHRRWSQWAVKKGRMAPLAASSSCRSSPVTRACTRPGPNSRGNRDPGLAGSHQLTGSDFGNAAPECTCAGMGGSLFAAALTRHNRLTAAAAPRFNGARLLEARRKLLISLYDALGQPAQITSRSCAG